MEGWQGSYDCEAEEQNWAPTTLSSVADLPTPPISCSNWLIADHLLIGGEPATEEVKKLVKSGINTFVCLCEFPSFEAYLQAYPSKIQKGKCNFIYFPIVDHETVEPNTLVVDFIKELRTLIYKGNKIFIHCLGGHGYETNIKLINY